MPSSSEFNPWTDAPEHEGLVSIGTHSLYLSISGAPRRRDHTKNKDVPNELVIIFVGAGDISLSWTPVLRRLLQSPGTANTSLTTVPSPPRIVIYDRSGLGRSERGPNRLIATCAAGELLSALQSTGLISYHESIILLAHSYGAIVAREFLHLLGSSSSSSPPSLSVSSEPQSRSQPQSQSESEPPRSQTQVQGLGSDSSIKALILAEPSNEKQHLHFPHPNPDFLSILGDLNYARISGFRANSKLTTQEWRLRAASLSSPSTQATTLEEISNYIEVGETLAQKRQIEKRVLGPRRPLVVIRAEGWKEYQAVYAAGVEAGNGTEEERERFGRLLAGWEGKDKMLKEELLGLSEGSKVLRVEVGGEDGGMDREEEAETELEKRQGKVGRKKMVLVKDCGHNIQLTRPDVVVREIYWVLDIVRRGDSMQEGVAQKPATGATVVAEKASL